jgi:hypothetical protein
LREKEENMKTPRIATIMIGFVLTLACSNDRPHGDAEGCEHLREGPAVTVAATATADAAPSIAADHQRYDVTLVAVTGGMGGFVRYAPGEAADYLFFLSAGVPVEFLDATSAPVAPEESASSSTACAEIKGRHLVPLEVGTSALRLGPTSQTSVSIVVEEAAHPPH